VDVQLIELTTLGQVAALKEGRIDAGLGRIRIDDPAVRREVLHEEPIVAAVASAHPLSRRKTVDLADLANEKIIVYPTQPRPSYADQVLTIFRDHGVIPDEVEEVREVQVALGLVASEAGIALVPASMTRLNRADICYVPINEVGATSPIILSLRAGIVPPEAELFEEVAREIFASWR
jgi:DNA-binding transcriptional LysR family regulator